MKTSIERYWSSAKITAYSSHHMALCIGVRDGLFFFSILFFFHVMVHADSLLAKRKKKEEKKASQLWNYSLFLFALSLCIPATFIVHLKKGCCCWLLNAPATCKCISGTDLLRQFYVLPHWDRHKRPIFPSHPVTVYWLWANQFQHLPYNPRRLAG